MVLVRVGAPAWLGAIVVSWGVVATAFAGLRGVTDFYLLRFLLGVTECGTFPGMWCAPVLQTANIQQVAWKGARMQGCALAFSCPACHGSHAGTQVMLWSRCIPDEGAWQLQKVTL